MSTLCHSVLKSFTYNDNNNNAAAGPFSWPHVKSFNSVQFTVRKDQQDSGNNKL